MEQGCGWAAMIPANVVEMTQQQNYSSGVDVASQMHNDLIPCAAKNLSSSKATSGRVSDVATATPRFFASSPLSINWANFQLLGEQRK